MHVSDCSMGGLGNCALYIAHVSNRANVEELVCGVASIGVRIRAPVQFLVLDKMDKQGIVCVCVLDMQVEQSTLLHPLTCWERAVQLSVVKRNSAILGGRHEV